MVMVNIHLFLNFHSVHMRMADFDEIVVFHRDVEEDDDTENKGTEGNPVSDVSDEYQFDKYDDEGTDPNPVLAIGNLTVYSSNSGDPYVTLGKNDDDEDSEKEDDIIKPEDNLILVGHVEGDASILEVYGKSVFIDYSSIYVVGSKSFRPDVQKSRQMENAVRDI